VTILDLPSFSLHPVRCSVPFAALLTALACTRSLLMPAMMPALQPGVGSVVEKSRLWRCQPLSLTWQACLLGLVVFLLVGIRVPPGYSQVCAFGTTPCVGRFGSGCYTPDYATCHDGLVCASGTRPCVGRFGGGCYNPAYAACHDGLVCAMPLRPCVVKGSVSCYDPSRATCTESQGEHRGGGRRKRH
jgi:hypothetical protein